jgi:hypothetical protein
MRVPSRWRQFTAPLVTAIVLILLAAGFWGQQKRSGDTTTVAQIARMRATLADGADCEFSADVRLTSRWSGFAFSLHKETVRTELVALLRQKSEYMVNSVQAREALRYQMLAAVNRIIGNGRATDLCFTAFEFL